MPDGYAYRRRENEITILRCFGESDDVVFPDLIENLPVTELADHIFAAEASAMEKDKEIRYIEGGLADVFSGKRGSLPQISTGLRRVRLPGHIRKIGSYAFYGCRKLEKIVLPASVEKLGNGIFTGCSRIREICFLSADTATPPCLKEILGEIEDELLISLADPSNGRETVRLRFPGYYENPVENTPARIIEIKYEGTGFLYRQCFLNREIDYSAYDRRFYLASVQERPSTAVGMALDRLLCPYLLEEKAKAAYLSYLREQYEVCADLVLGSADEIRYLQMLCREGAVTENLLGYWTDRCAAEGHARAVSILMNYRAELFPVKKKVYRWEE